MTNPTWSQGEVLLAHLDFSDSPAGKRRPVLVVYDFGDEDLLAFRTTLAAICQRLLNQGERAVQPQ